MNGALLVVDLVGEDGDAGVPAADPAAPSSLSPSGELTVAVPVVVESFLALPGVAAVAAAAIFTLLPGEANPGEASDF